MKTNCNTSPYSKIFGHKTFKSSTCRSVIQLLGFTVLYDIEGNSMSKEDLLDKVAEISPSPHSIFTDNEGYLLRFELHTPFDIEDEEDENRLREMILNFLEGNNIVSGKLQEMEIGKWESHTFLLDNSEEVECL